MNDVAPAPTWLPSWLEALWLLLATYPPLLARLLVPLTGLEIGQAKWIYIGVCLAAFFLLLIPFLRNRFQRESERWALAAVLLGWGPLIYSIRLGQCELLAIPFLALAWKCGT